MATSTGTWYTLDMGSGATTYTTTSTASNASTVYWTDQADARTYTYGYTLNDVAFRNVVKPKRKNELQSVIDDCVKELKGGS
jgi:hypothetical protein